MARKNTRQRAREFSNMFSRNISNLRAGLDEDAKDLDRKSLAMFARVVGFILLVAGMLFLVSTLQKFGILR